MPEVKNAVWKPKPLLGDDFFIIFHGFLENWPFYPFKYPMTLDIVPVTTQ